jgi:hypothetical protein
MIKHLCTVLVLAMILFAPPSMATEMDSSQCQNVSANGGPTVRLRVNINNPVSRHLKVGEVLGTLTYEGGTFICTWPDSIAGWVLYFKPNMPYVKGTDTCSFGDFSTLTFSFISRYGRPVRCDRNVWLGSITGTTAKGNVKFIFPERVVANITVGAPGLRPPGESYQLDFSRFTTSDTNYSIAIDGDTTIYFSEPQMQIYFPQSPLAPPTVDLGLANGPGKTLSGVRQLDMCLYDGHDSTSKLISLTFRDEAASAAGRAPGMFSVYRQGSDKSKPTDRLDYALSIVNPVTGASETVTEGKEFFWAGMNNRSIQRQVNLPGTPGLTYCVPAPLTFTTPVFKADGKNAGHYTGLLKVIYRVPTFG